MAYQSLKSIHYKTLLIFQNKKKTDLRVKTWGWGYITPIPSRFTPLVIIDRSFTQYCFKVIEK